MELKEFQYLITLADEGSVSKAADKLYMSQSSLSQSLQQYESELGVKLFLRTSKGIHPTANGEVFPFRLESRSLIAVAGDAQLIVHPFRKLAGKFCTFLKGYS